MHPESLEILETVSDERGECDMSTYRLMEHTRHRWDTMSRKALMTRVNRITNVEKLECFIRVALDEDDEEIAQMCRRRRSQLARQLVRSAFGDSLTPTPDNTETRQRRHEVRRALKVEVKEQAFSTGERYIDW